MQLTIEIPEHWTKAASWKSYPAYLEASGHFSAAELVVKLIEALEQKQAAEKAAEEEAKRERFIITYRDYASLGLWYSGMETSWLGNPDGYDGDVWYEITNPEEVGLTSYSPVVLPDPEPLPPTSSYIEPSQVREGMRVEVEETFRNTDEGASRIRYTTGVVTDLNPSEYGPNAPKVGGVRVQLANRDDADVWIYFYGMAEGAA